jgi:protein SCO1/2
MHTQDSTDAPANIGSPPRTRRPQRFAFRRVLAAVFFAVSVVVPVTVAVRRVAEWMRPAPPVLGQVPDFELTDQDGQSLSSRDLLGTVWVANFIFTRCRGVCPALTQQMQHFLQRCPAARELRVVSVSVDPATDTPPVLRRYAEERGALEPRWSFVTGAPEAVRALVTRGFRLALEEQGGRGDEPIVHSDRFVLVDRNGRIRGYYHGLDSTALDRLCVEAGRVSKERRTAGS